MTDAVCVAVETPLQPEVEALLAQSDAVAAQLYPGAYRRPITPQTLATPHTLVLVARLAGQAVGLCVVFARDDSTVEVKRMIVDEAARGCGVGAALLAAAHATARHLGAHTARLEVGIRNLAAQALYRSAGYTPCAPFLPYAADPISLFMSRPI